MKILGAGMSGCLAGLINPQAQIYEAQENPPINHNAVLRFRDDSVSKVTGIPFKKVTVRKGIWYSGSFVQPNIELCNEYSAKVTGKVQNRSIWNLDTVSRYIAPPNFQEQLYDLVSDRVKLNNDISKIEPDGPLLSTIPMPSLLKLLELEENPDIEFSFQSIIVVTAEIPNCDVYQTVYFPNLDRKLYRTTITGNKLIMEFANAVDDEISQYILYSEIDQMTQLFSIEKPINISEQKLQNYGKIAPIDDTWRRKTLYRLTHEFNIYSAGRYAIWKNILMDDVLQDLRVIKEMQAKDSYEHHRRY